MNAVNATTARKTLFSLLEQVNEDAEAVQITSKRGNAFLVPEAEYRSVMETAHLMASPRNAKRLMRSIDQIDAGRVKSFDSVDEVVGLPADEDAPEAVSAAQ